MRIVATILDKLLPQHDASGRQFIRQATSLADLVVLTSEDAVVPLNELGSVHRLCVALAQSI